MSGFLNSYKENATGIILIIIASVLTSIGQMFWKLSYINSRYLVLLGFACYGLGAVMMIIAFKYGSFSVLHPMLSLSYILAIILGVVILKESMSIMKVIGILFIMFGVFLIGGGDD